VSILSVNSGDSTGETEVAHDGVSDGTPGSGTAASVARSNGPAPAPVTTADLAIPPPAKTGAIPSYAIDDESRVEITQTTHKFQQSMAANHFNSTSVEASMSVVPFILPFPTLVFRTKCPLQNITAYRQTI
jgi:hypothetical protein